MTMANPLVSVCIPTYNGSAFIATTIESVLHQTMTDYELVIIDDNSKDDTLHIIDKYICDKRIRIIKNVCNLGVEANWNKCLEKSIGRYIKILHQDDILEKDCLQKQVDILEKDYDHKISFVFSQRNIIDEKNNILMLRGYHTKEEGRISALKVIKNCVRSGYNPIGEPGAVLFRRNAISGVGLFNQKYPYVIDLDYWIRLLSVGDAYFIPKPLFSFRISSSACSTIMRKEQGKQVVEFYKKIKLEYPAAITELDYYTGIIMAYLNNYLRRIFYFIFIKKGH